MAHRKLWALVGLGGVALIALVGVGSWFLLEVEPAYPSEWDARVTDLVTFVEDERELDFDHPVHIDFLTPEEYSAAARADEAELTDEDRAEIEDSEALLRALGLVSDDVDLFDATNDLSDAGTLAYYDDTTNRITVRGTEMTVDLQATLVHELTHALQDQHFDLGRLREFETTGESAAFRAVVEGDASLVEENYVGAFDDADMEEYQATIDEQLEAVPYDGIPSFLTASFSAPYALGTPLVGIVQADGGWDAVDDMLVTPPTTEVELLDPLIYLDGITVRDVDLPEPGEDVEVIEESDFGAITLYLMLATRMDARDALDAADSWGGDAYRTERDDGVLCVTIATEAIDDESADTLEDALSTWATDTEATVERDAELVVLRSCDPGAEDLADPVTDPFDAIALPATRSYVILGTVSQQGASPEEGACVADAVVTQVPLEVLSDPEPTDEELEQLFAVMGSAAPKCVAA
jgi:hypothetical protein